MNYKVLYRKYRPDSFKNLVGQKHIINILKNSIKEQKISHAYLFSGPRGTGKTSTARILAKSVNCLNPEEGTACGNCANCQSFSTNPDIIEIDAASNNGVDEIRELINNVKIMPTISKYKVYIIDEVHMLSQSAFNALLLTLEEPPEHVIFILATTNLESVPITILSRCQKYDFKRITTEDIIERLKYVCQSEAIEYEENALKEIALLSDGGLRDALSILDQLSKNASKITMDIITNEIGTISNQKIEEFIVAIDQNDIDQVENQIEELKNINLNYKVFIKKMIESLGKRAIKYLKNDVTSRLSYDDYKNMTLELNEIINKINVSVEPYSLIEMILLSYIKTNSSNNSDNNVEDNNKPSKSENQVIEQVSHDKETNVKESVKKPIPKIKDNFITTRINNCFVNARKDYLKNIKELWQNYETKATSQIRGMISDTIPVTASDEYIICVTTIKHKDQELNENVNFIEEDFATYAQSKYKMVFIDEETWSLEKTKYINNLQSGYKYEIIDEKSPIKDEKKENLSIENIASDIFDSEKIEIE